MSIVNQYSRLQQVRQRNWPPGLLPSPSFLLPVLPTRLHKAPRVGAKRLTYESYVSSKASALSAFCETHKARTSTNALWLFATACLSIRTAQLRASLILPCTPAFDSTSASRFQASDQLTASRRHGAPSTIFAWRTAIRLVDSLVNNGAYSLAPFDGNTQRLKLRQEWQTLLMFHPTSALNFVVDFFLSFPISRAVDTSR